MDLGKKRGGTTAGRSGERENFDQDILYERRIYLRLMMKEKKRRRRKVGRKCTMGLLGSCILAKPWNYTGCLLGSFLSILYGAGHREHKETENHKESLRESKHVSAQITKLCKWVTHQYISLSS